MRRKEFNPATLYTIAVCLLLLIVDTVLGVVLVSQARQTILTQIKGRMLDVAQIAATSVDGDRLAEVTGQDCEAYQDVVASLSRVQALFSKSIDMKYVYTVHDNGDHTFSFTVDPDPDDPGQYGEPVPYSNAALNASRGTPDADMTPVQDRWGRYYTAYSPVYDSNGQIVGMVGADFAAEWIEDQLVHFSITVIVFSAISLLVGAGLVLFVTAGLRKRYNVLYKELTVLASDVETLTKEVTDRMEYNQTVGAAGTSGTQSADAMTKLGDEIHYMQKEIKQYVAFVQKQAYTDSMTGVGNKTAYLELVRKLDKEILEGNPAFAIAVFDINGLKTINDNYGHENGDRVITDAARMIRDVFGTEHVFRIGGDEFIAVLEGLSADDVFDGFEKLDEIMERFNESERQYPMTLAFSKGCAAYLPGVDEEYRTVFKRADEAMYRDKGDYYRGQQDK